MPMTSRIGAAAGSPNTSCRARHRSLRSCARAASHLLSGLQVAPSSSARSRVSSLARRLKPANPEDSSGEPDSGIGPPRSQAPKTRSVARTGKQRMEPLWSRWQSTANRLRPGPETFHGKEGVDGSSPARARVVSSALRRRCCHCSGRVASSRSRAAQPQPTAADSARSCAPVRDKGSSTGST
jgi:hypothetical protein